MRKQKQYFINGVILIIIAMMVVTIIPYCADKFKINIEKTSYSEFEFFCLCASSLFYLFSPKYYKNQIFSIFLAYLYYCGFTLLYPML